MKTLTRSVVISLLLLVVDRSPVYAQSEADAIGSAAAPAASTTSVRRATPKYADPSIGLELEYKVDNAEVCVAWPERLQDAACEGMDIRNVVASAVRSTAASTAANGPTLQSMAVLRYDNSTAIISVAHVPNTKTYIAQEEIDDLLNSFLKGVKMVVPATMSGSTPGSRYDVMEINGMTAVRFEMTADLPRGAPGYERSRAVGYVLLGKHGKLLISAATDPQHMPQTRIALESIVRTVGMPKSAQKGFGKTSTLDRLLDSELAPLVLVLSIAGVLTIFERGRRKKRRSRQR